MWHGNHAATSVPTLDDLTLVISVTLMYPIRRTPHADVSISMRAVHHAAALARLFLAPSQVDTAGLPLNSSLPWWHNRFFALSTPLVTLRHSELVTVTMPTKAHCSATQPVFSSRVLVLSPRALAFQISSSIFTSSSRADHPQ